MMEPSKWDHLHRRGYRYSLQANPPDDTFAKIRNAFWAMVKSCGSDPAAIRDRIDSEAMFRGIWKRADYDDLEAEILSDELRGRGL